MKQLLMPLALIHRVCPLCLMAKLWPGSPVARIRMAIAKGCPFCRADAKIRSGSSKKDNREGGETNALG